MQLPWYPHLLTRKLFSQLLENQKDMLRKQQVASSIESITEVIICCTSCFQGDWYLILETRNVKWYFWFRKLIKSFNRCFTSNVPLLLQRFATLLLSNAYFIECFCCAQVLLIFSWSALFNLEIFFFFCILLFILLASINATVFTPNLGYKLVPGRKRQCDLTFLWSIHACGYDRESFQTKH